MSDLAPVSWVGRVAGQPGGLYWWTVSAGGGSPHGTGIWVGQGQVLSLVWYQYLDVLSLRTNLPESSSRAGLRVREAMLGWACEGWSGICPDLCKGVYLYFSPISWIHLFFYILLCSLTICQVMNIFSATILTCASVSWFNKIVACNYHCSLLRSTFSVHYTFLNIWEQFTKLFEGIFSLLCFALNS